MELEKCILNCLGIPKVITRVVVRKRESKKAEVEKEMKQHTWGLNDIGLRAKECVQLLQVGKSKGTNSPRVYR